MAKGAYNPDGSSRVTDAWDFAKAYVVATPRAPGKGILITTTVAGNCVLRMNGTLPDGTASDDVTITLVIGTTYYPIAVSQVVSSAATATFWAMS